MYNYGNIKVTFYKNEKMYESSVFKYYDIHLFKSTLNVNFKSVRQAYKINIYVKRVIC